MSDTPETENLARGNHVVPTEWAQQLERERDEARNQRDILRLDAQKEDIHHDRMIGELERVYAERDEAREKIERQRERIAYLEGATHHACGTPLSKAIKERDEARLELKGCKAKNKRISAELLVKLQDIERERDEAQGAQRHFQALAQSVAETCAKLKEERDEAIRHLENHTASTIHSCHDQCQRPMCVLRRERDEAISALREISNAQHFGDIGDWARNIAKKVLEKNND